MNKELDIVVNNAGIVLLVPFLPRLFNILQLTESGKFRDKESQIRAIFLIQYIVFERSESLKDEMTINKILTGFEIENPISHSINLTEEEIRTINEMLQGVLLYWEKLKNISSAGFRETFLQRKGRLEIRCGDMLLTVESKAYDILLDTIPWSSYNPVKFRWMEKALQVKWR